MVNNTKLRYKDINISHLLSSQQENRISKVLEDFQNAFSDILGRIDSIQHKIVLTSDTPIRSRSYPIPVRYRSAVQQEIRDMLQIIVIGESDSYFCSLLIVVKKKDNSLHLCID